GPWLRRRRAVLPGGWRGQLERAGSAQRRRGRCDPGAPRLLAPGAVVAGGAGGAAGLRIGGGAGLLLGLRDRLSGATADAGRGSGSRLGQRSAPDGDGERIPWRDLLRAASRCADSRALLHGGRRRGPVTLQRRGGAYLLLPA